MIDKDEQLNKFQLFYPILVQWLSIRQEGRSLVEWFENNKIKHIAIYGMKELGERLYEELKNSSVEVSYAIDMNSEYIYSEIEVYAPSNKLPHVDMIVVTAILYYEEVKDKLKGMVDYPVVSLADIVFEEA